ncbi:MAG TPA: ATP-binding protein [Gemmataceae bacterium]|nr:ATP-binding protein [Gemmataceae bacterium]
MSLTTRVLVFFLSALALVLVGFSATLYALAHRHLTNQVDERLMAALDMLDAAVDRDPKGLRWEPHEHLVPLGDDTGPEAVRWEVRDHKGNVLACSNNVGEIALGENPVVNGQVSDQGVEWLERGGQRWQLAWRRVYGSHVSTASVPGKSSPRLSMMTLTAGMSLEPMHATLNRLAMALGGLSGGVFLTAAIGGYWVCRKALAPVTRMAAAAREMGAADLGKRLPDPATRDELGALHTAFNDLLDRLQEAFERQRRFTGDASHQLRTPLTAILGQVEVALRRERPAEDYRKVLELVFGRTDHLRQIVEALLFLARADADAELACLEVVDLTAWLPQHLQNWKDHPRAGEINVQSVAGCVVRAQSVLLGQLVDNLLDNAFKYSAAGTPVTITLQHAEKVIALAVQDAGPGISADDLPHVFEAFFRSAEARRLGTAGVGLGLAMAQRIAVACGGTLAVASETGRGSQFTLRLPAVTGS